ncbi:hypothetical protein JXQ70_16320 [bacterium]|nr:hypothetical protein [bacterium]
MRTVVWATIVIGTVTCLSVILMGTATQAFETSLPGLGETGFFFTETAIYRYFTDDEYVEKFEDDEADEFINRLNLRITNRDYVVGLRFDVDLNTVEDEEYRLEKKFFQVNKQSWSLELGDYYYSLGRGLVLNIVKSFEEEGSEYQIERTILGGRFSYIGSKLSATVLGGLVEEDDPELEDTIGGGTIAGTFMESFTIGLNALGISFHEDDQRDEYERFDQGLIGSLSLSVPSLTDYGSLYLECAAVNLEVEQDRDEDNLEGWAAYLETAAYLGNWIIQFEAKRYRDFLFPYHNPPLLEPEEFGIMAEQFVLDTTDVSAVRTRLDYTVPDTQTVIYAVQGYIDDSPEEHFFYGSYKRYINEYYLGVDSYLANDYHLMGAVGYRYERAYLGTPSDYMGYTPHAFFSAKVPLTAKQSLEMTANWKQFTEDARNSEEPIDYSRQEYSLGYHYSPYLALIGTYEFYDDKRAQFYDPTASTDTDFHSVTLQIRPLDNLTMKLFYGSTPGGVKCSSGVCKSFPPFEGYRAELVFRF